MPNKFMGFTKAVKAGASSLAKKLGISKTTNEATNEFYDAIAANDIEAVRLLIQADPEIVNKIATNKIKYLGASPLAWAIEYGHVQLEEQNLDVVRLLIANGADINKITTHPSNKTIGEFYDNKKESANGTLVFLAFSSYDDIRSSYTSLISARINGKPYGGPVLIGGDGLELAKLLISNGANIPGMIAADNSQLAGNERRTTLNNTFISQAFMPRAIQLWEMSNKHPAQAIQLWGTLNRTPIKLPNELIKSVSDLVNPVQQTLAHEMQNLCDIPLERAEELSAKLLMIIPTLTAAELQQQRSYIVKFVGLMERTSAAISAPLRKNDVLDKFVKGPEFRETFIKIFENIITADKYYTVATVADIIKMQQWSQRIAETMSNQEQKLNLYDLEIISTVLLYSIIGDKSQATTALRDLAIQHEKPYVGILTEIVSEMPDTPKIKM